MKFYNKKKVERSDWIKIRGPHPHKRDAKIWCQRQNSNGRFYYHYASSNWWFENQQDAVVFKLVWN